MTANAARPALGLPADLDMRALIRPELATARAQLRIFDGTVSYLELAYATPPGFRPLVLDLHIPQSTDAAIPVVRVAPDAPVPEVAGRLPGFSRIAGADAPSTRRFLRERQMSLAGPAA